MKLPQAVEQYITLKQSLGFRFHTESQILKAFSKAMGKSRLGQIKPKAVRALLDGHGPVTQNWSRKWVALRGFYDFAVARGLVRRSPLPAEAPKVAVMFTPYIYTQQELQHLLHLGHVDIAATQKYLTLTPELREQASARFARYALGGSHE